MDETALAIARSREEAKADKPSRRERLASDVTKAPRGHSGSGTAHRTAGQVSPASSTKRQKSGGG